MNLLKQVGRFLVVGGLAFCVDYGVLWVLAECLRFNYLVAATISFFASVVFNYILSSLWVFQGSQKLTSVGNFLAFSVLSGIGLLINLAVMWVWVDILLGNYLVAKVFSTGIVMVYNFVSRKVFIERRLVAKSLQRST